MQTNLGPLAPMLTCENVAQRTAVCGDGNWHGNRHVVQNEGSWRYVQYSIEWLVWICTHTDNKSPVNINLSQRGLCLLTNIRIRVLGVHYFPQIHPEVWSNIFLEARFDKGQVVWDDPWLNIELNLKRLVCVGEKNWHDKSHKEGDLKLWKSEAFWYYRVLSGFGSLKSRPKHKPGQFISTVANLIATRCLFWELILPKMTLIQVEDGETSWGNLTCLPTGGLPPPAAFRSAIWWFTRDLKILECWIPTTKVVQFDGLRLYKIWLSTQYQRISNSMESLSQWPEICHFLGITYLVGKITVYKIEHLKNMVLGLNLVVFFSVWNMVSSDGNALSKGSCAFPKSHWKWVFRGHLDPLVLFDIFVRSQSWDVHACMKYVHVYITAYI